MGCNASHSTGVHGRPVQKEENHAPITGGIYNCSASYCGCSSSPKSHVLYLFGPHVESHPMLQEKILDDNEYINCCCGYCKWLVFNHVLVRHIYNIFIELLAFIHVNHVYDVYCVGIINK